MNNEIKQLEAGKLKVKIYNNRISAGKAAAGNVADLIKDYLQKQDFIRMIFAAAPSQNEFLDELVKSGDIDWNRIIAFHMDEYVGLNRNSDQLFSTYLKRRIFDKVSFKEVHLIEAFDDPEKECTRYEQLLRENPVDIVCMGIGENGHIAFNDPPVADFDDPKHVKIAALDEACRQQQVNDGCFPEIDEVPKQAVTLTIPALMNGRHLSVVVPGKNKANAVKQTMHGNISTECPASILRNHNNAVMYLDSDSASKLK